MMKKKKTRSMVVIPWRLCLHTCNAQSIQVTVRDPRTNTNYTMDVPEDRYIFWAFEDAGIDLPMMNGKRMCRNGACTTCAVKVRVAEVDNQMGFVLRLPCLELPFTRCFADHHHHPPSPPSPLPQHPAIRAAGRG
jgi:ferredoxin